MKKRGIIITAAVLLVLSAVYFIFGVQRYSNIEKIEVMTASYN